MKTQLLCADSKGIKQAGELLKKGKLVAIPTETVYGLAANALDSEAVGAIFKAKGRPQDNPLIMHISTPNELRELVVEVSDDGGKLIDAFWPGPLTIVMKKSNIVPDNVSAGLDTVAVRMPSHKVARDIIKAAGTPLAAPSANKSGSPSPTTAMHVFNDLNGVISAVVDGGSCEVGLESTVVDLTGKVPRILRPGGISAEMIKNVVGNVDIDPSVDTKVKFDDNTKACSPGMKYKHYAPKTPLILVKADKTQFVNYVNSKKHENIGAMCFDEEQDVLQVPFIPYGKREDFKSQAHNLFGVLRKLDDLNVSKIYACAPDTQGMGFAIYNRLLRAASFNVVDLK